MISDYIILYIFLLNLIIFLLYFLSYMLVGTNGIDFVPRVVMGGEDRITSFLYIHSFKILSYFIKKFCQVVHLETILIKLKLIT